MEFYAIAWTGPAKGESVFAVGTVRDGKLDWDKKKQRISCPLLKLVTLATSDKSPGKVYAAARGRGIYQFNLETATAPTDPLLDCKATGHLVAAALSDRPHRALHLGVGRTEVRHYGTPADHARAHGLDAAGLRASMWEFVTHG